MKNIVISNRKYRSILAKLKDLADCLNDLRPETEGITDRKTVDNDDTGEVYIDSEKGLRTAVYQRADVASSVQSLSNKKYPCVASTLLSVKRN